MESNNKSEKLCIDCVHFDDCEHSCIDGVVCDKFSEARYVLTPKGIWYACCLEEFGDEQENDWFDENLCMRFFEKYSNSMYAAGLISDGDESRLKRLLNRVKRCFKPKSQKNSVSLLLDIARKDEFVGTPLSDEAVIRRIYDNFTKTMVSHGYAE